MTEDKSTPRPWRIRPDPDIRNQWIISDANGTAVEYCDERGLPDWKLIVSAVNSHDAMKECVEALKEFVAIAELSEPGVNINFALALRKVKAKAALLKLEKANDHS